MASQYMVLLKIHGSDIKLDRTLNPASKTPSYRVLCYDLEQARERGSAGLAASVSGMQVFDLNGPMDEKNGGFRGQSQFGQELGVSNTIMFLSQTPIDGRGKASYALDIGLNNLLKSSMDDLTGEEAHHCPRVGTAYIYLDPKFSTQGVEGMQIMAPGGRTKVGQMQVQYLIINEPSGYGVKVARPEWLSKVPQLDAGHRGAGSGCRSDLNGKPITENTVASFNYAARHGADMVELDVMCTADGVPIVYHDYSLNSINKRTQIAELTLHQLHLLRHLAIHDKNCTHDRSKENSKIDIGSSISERSDQPFPTLEEVLKDVDKSCAMNIELKWAQMLPNGKSEATHYREINDNVERILDCIYKHSNGRAILLSTFNVDVAVALRLKQTKYPVLFLTTGDSERFSDPVTKSIKNAIHFARAFDLAGVNPNVAKLDKELVSYAQDCGLLVYAWGQIESCQKIKELKRYGINGLIYDKIDVIKPRD